MLTACVGGGIEMLCVCMCWLRVAEQELSAQQVGSRYSERGKGCPSSTWCVGVCSVVVLCTPTCMGFV